MQPLFESERLYARQFTMADADNFYLMNSDEAVMRFIRPVKTKIASDLFLQEAIAAYIKARSWRLALIRKQDEVFIGTFAIIPLEETIDMQLGYALLPQYWRRGYASEIVKAGIRYAFNHLQILQLKAVTEIGNEASQHVLRKAGFQQLPNIMRVNKELCLFVLTKT